MPGSFPTKEEVDKICRVARELEGVAKAFKSSLALAKSTGLSHYKAVKAANAATFEQTGCDCLDLLNIKDWVEKEMSAKIASPQWGQTLLDEILHCAVPLDVPGDNGRKSSYVEIKDVLFDRTLHNGFKTEIEGYGIKKAEKGIFFHPNTLEEHLLPRISGWSGYSIREFLMSIPGARTSQLRLNGVAVRGVMVPQIQAAEKGGAS